MLLSFWTFSSLILGYVILWAPEGIQIGNRMLLSKASICMWRTEASLVQSPILDLFWNLDQWCILAWRACKKNFHNQIWQQFVFFLRKLYKWTPKFDFYYQLTWISHSIFETNNLSLILVSFNLKSQYLAIQLVTQDYKQWTFYLSTDPGISYTFGLLMNRERNNPKEKWNPGMEK